ncbi:MAG: hypothetical protein IJT12_06060, partial [Paludibacteraceae bacterium]|nr:hypothetical protein [Paludibacteraceae bacterium]
MKHYLLSLFAGLACCMTAGAATITYVYDGSKTAAENGTALQAAIDGASSGDELKVQAGTYVGNFTMKEGVNVSGGWNAGFTAQTDYATILDANESGRVVEQPSNFTTLTIWSNLTIQNGKLTAISDTPASGLSSGVALGKKGQVKHCKIQNNTFDYNGNCMGGGVGNDAVDTNTDVCVDDCWILNNCGTHGGGVRIRGTIQNSVIENNNTNNTVKKGPGGGVYLQAGRMVGCIVRNNTSGGDTGGVDCYGKGAVINCLVIGNTATGKVGGISIRSANSDIIGNTVVGNNELGVQETVSHCGISCQATSDNGTKFVNNVIWGNKHQGTVQDEQVYYISHYNNENKCNNAVMKQTIGSNSIQLTADDPGFTDAANGDFSLLSSSVLLDIGNSSYVTVSKDLAGNDRIVNFSVDIGAYEYPVVASDVYVLEGEDLQSKINITATGYTVYVQAGTYYGNFTMKDGVNVSGGWNEDFTSQTDYATILDANNSGRVVTQSAAFSNLTVWSNLT